MNAGRNQRGIALAFAVILNLHHACLALNFNPSTASYEDFLVEITDDVDASDCVRVLTILEDPTWENSFPSGADLLVSGSQRGPGLKMPHTMQNLGCGSPGLQIHFPAQFLLSSSDLGCNGGKIFLAEFAKYRYGVFDEHGFEGDPIYPLAYANSNGQLSPTACANHPPDAEFSNLERCWWDMSSESCFWDLVNGTETIVTSVMSQPLLEQASKFCGSSDDHPHNKEAPTKQNMFCGERSVWEVIEQHPDFTNSNARSAILKAGKSVNVRPDFKVVAPPTESSTTPLFMIFNKWIFRPSSPASSAPDEWKARCHSLFHPLFFLQRSSSSFHAGNVKGKDGSMTLWNGDDKDDLLSQLFPSNSAIGSLCFYSSLDTNPAGMGELFSMEGLLSRLAQGNNTRVDFIPDALVRATPLVWIHGVDYDITDEELETIERNYVDQFHIPVYQVVDAPSRIPNIDHASQLERMSRISKYGQFLVFMSDERRPGLTQARFSEALTTAVLPLLAPSSAIPSMVYSNSLNPDLDAFVCDTQQTVKNIIINIPSSTNKDSLLFFSFFGIPYDKFPLKPGETIDITLTSPSGDISKKATAAFGSAGFYSAEVFVTAEIFRPSSPASSAPDEWKARCHSLFHPLFFLQRSSSSFHAGNVKGKDGSMTLWNGDDKDDLLSQLFPSNSAIGSLCFYSSLDTNPAGMGERFSMEGLLSRLAQGNNTRVDFIPDALVRATPLVWIHGVDYDITDEELETIERNYVDQFHIPVYQVVDAPSRIPNIDQASQLERMSRISKYGQFLVFMGDERRPGLTQARFSEALTTAVLPLLAPSSAIPSMVYSNSLNPDLDAFVCDTQQTVKKIIINIPSSTSKDSLLFFSFFGIPYDKFPLKPGETIDITLTSPSGDISKKATPAFGSAGFYSAEVFVTAEESGTWNISTTCVWPQIKAVPLYISIYFLGDNNNPEPDFIRTLLPPTLLKSSFPSTNAVDTGFAHPPVVQIMAQRGGKPIVGLDVKAKIQGSTGTTEKNLHDSGVGMYDVTGGDGIYSGALDIRKPGFYHTSFIITSAETQENVPPDTPSSAIDDKCCGSIYPQGSAVGPASNWTRILMGPSFVVGNDLGAFPPEKVTDLAFSIDPNDNSAIFISWSMIDRDAEMTSIRDSAGSDSTCVEIRTSTCKEGVVEDFKSSPSIENSYHVFCSCNDRSTYTSACNRVLCSTTPRNKMGIIKADNDDRLKIRCQLTRKMDADDDDADDKKPAYVTLRIKSRTDGSYVSDVSNLVVVYDPEAMVHFEATNDENVCTETTVKKPLMSKEEQKIEDLKREIRLLYMFGGTAIGALLLLVVVLSICLAFPGKFKPGCSETRHHHTIATSTLAQNHHQAEPVGISQPFSSWRAGSMIINNQRRPTDFHQHITTSGLTNRAFTNESDIRGEISDDFTDDEEVIADTTQHRSSQPIEAFNRFNYTNGSYNISQVIDHRSPSAVSSSRSPVPPPLPPRQFTNLNRTSSTWSDRHPLRNLIPLRNFESNDLLDSFDIKASQDRDLLQNDFAGSESIICVNPEIITQFNKEHKPKRFFCEARPSSDCYIAIRLKGINEPNAISNIVKFVNPKNFYKPQPSDDDKDSRGALDHDLMLSYIIFGSVTLILLITVIVLVVLLIFTRRKLVEAYRSQLPRYGHQMPSSSPAETTPNAGYNKASKLIGETPLRFTSNSASQSPVSHSIASGTTRNEAIYDSPWAMGSFQATNSGSIDSSHAVTSPASTNAAETLAPIGGTSRAEHLQFAGINVDRRRRRQGDISKNEAILPPKIGEIGSTNRGFDFDDLDEGVWSTQEVSISKPCEAVNSVAFDYSKKVFPAISQQHTNNKMKISYV
ncbi:unnamed protein product [Notodromas monacha]|uniref:Calcium-activated chloride channel N-terminal domain-containing protein n=1 Tax=Notodromas monacha TaxID=399045 RepID=A0A7R9GFH2_9CRUS|nr:unnamed protein product [Notodromas monacha]CAG0920698.1 unnamed protein product [Notodromas monacha]